MRQWLMVWVVAMASVCGPIAVADAADQAAPSTFRFGGVVKSVDVKDSKHPVVTLHWAQWPDVVLQVDPKKTVMTKNNQPFSISDLKVGDTVFATYEAKGNKNIALTLTLQPPQTTAPTMTNAPAKPDTTTRKR